MGFLADFWSAVWGDVTSRVSPSPVAALVPLAVVFVALAVPTLWHAVRHAVTIVHEAGHALVAVLLGRRVSGIRLHSDTSGLTTHAGDTRRLPLALVAFAGYPAAGVLGLGAAFALGDGWAYGVLWAFVAVLLLVLVQIRNVYGFVVMVVALGALGWVAWAAPLAWAVGVAYGLVWLLLLGAVRAVVELSRTRRRPGGGGSDADNLARLTRVPAGAWVGLFWLVTVACAVAGAWLIVGPLGLG